jgi:hypothetical protein
MDPRVPYTFDPPAEEYEEEHLVWEKARGGKFASWPVIGERIFVPKKLSSLDDYILPNSGAFKPHGNFGFTLGRYSEFLVATPEHCAFDMAGVEASFGETTPLAAMIFYPIHQRKRHGEWQEFTSLRILGAGKDLAEAAFLNAMKAIHEKFEFLPDITHLWPVEDWEYSDQTNEVHESPPIITDIDPLRFYYDGLAQNDAIAACIYFYRTLEYFSFLTNATEINALRNDSTTTDAEFPRRILRLITRDEKGPIFKLITSIADQKLLDYGKSTGLIKDAVSSTLCDGIYAFRNSIVHGKFSYGYSLVSGSVLQHEPEYHYWRETLRSLARSALEKFGSRSV